MSDLTLFQQAGVPDVAQFKTGLQHARQSAPKTTGGVQYLKMNQVGSPLAGELTYGAEGTPVEDGSLWVVNPFGIQHGFILRDGGSVNNEIYAPITQPLPSELPPARGQEQWRQSYMAQMVCISGEDLGTLVEYSGDAGGVVKLFRDVLLPAIESQIDVDPNKILPAVSFEVTSYYSNKQKKDIYEARGTIEKWLSMDELMKLVGEKALQSGSHEEKPAPADDTPTPDDAPPKRTANRRRRRSA